MTNCEQNIIDSTYSRIPNITNSHHRVTISQTHDNIRFTMTSETDSITCSNHILTSRTHYIPLMTSDSQWHQRLTMSHTHNVIYSHHINHRLTITSQTHQTPDSGQLQIHNDIRDRQYHIFTFNMTDSPEHYRCTSLTNRHHRLTISQTHDNKRFTMASQTQYHILTVRS